MLRALVTALALLFIAALFLAASGSLHAQDYPKLDYNEPVSWEQLNAQLVAPIQADDVDGDAGGIGVIAARITDVRCVQIQYFGQEGGTVRCKWTRTGEFNHIKISVDNISRGRLPGDADGADLDKFILPPGNHKIRVEGVQADRTQEIETEIKILSSPPVVIEPVHWIAYGFSTGDNSGRIRVTWEIFNPLNLVLQNFEICVFRNNALACQKVTLPACSDNGLEPSPDGGVAECVLRTSMTLNRLVSGCYRFEVRAFSFRYASSVASICTSGRPLSGPVGVHCTGMSCTAGHINALEVSFSVPESFDYDAVALWSVQNGTWDFLGFSDPFADSVFVRNVNLSLEPFELEVAGARRLDQSEVCPELRTAGGINDPGDVIGDPDFATMCPNVVAAPVDEAPGDPNSPGFAEQLVLFTNLPGSDIGPRSTVQCDPCASNVACAEVAGCVVAPQEVSFRRGDVNVDGEVDIVDVLAELFIMFRGVGDFPCPDAADVDNNGRIQINDPICLLFELFLGRGHVQDPGPFFCGLDDFADVAAEDSLPLCRYPTQSCDTLGPVDPDVDPFGPAD